MNILNLIHQLDLTDLEREIRDCGKKGEVITYYNEKCLVLALLVNSTDLYSELVQICLAESDDGYIAYVQHGDNPDFVKIPISKINSLVVE